MPWTQPQIDALERAIALGSTRVRYSDPAGTQEVEYRSLAEMMALLAQMRLDIGFVTGGRRLILSSMSKGTTP